MNGYEQIIKLMRQQGAAKNPSTLQLAEMTSATACKVGALKLSKGDLLIPEHLTNYKVKIDVVKAGNVANPTIDNLETEGAKIKVYGALKKGDLVLVQRLSDEKYAIVEKVLEVV